MLIESFSAVLVEKREKQFPDGGKGWFCVLLKEDETLVQAWLPSGVSGAENLESCDVERYRVDCAGFFRVSKRIWNNETKRTIVDFTQ